MSLSDFPQRLVRSLKGSFTCVRNRRRVALTLAAATLGIEVVEVAEVIRGSRSSYTIVRALTLVLRGD